MSSAYKHTRYLDGQLVSGVLAVAALAGQFVSNKNLAAAAGVVSQHDAPAFELSTGRRCFALFRDVLNATEQTLDSMIRQEESGHLSPALVGDVVTARPLLEGEFEGTDFLVVSGAQALSTATPLRSPLTTVGGKLALMTGDQIEVTSVGRNLAGALTLAGTRVGDKVRSVTNLAGGDATASFESTITVAGQIQQSAASDLSAVSYLFVIETPNTLQEMVGRLAGFLEPEDAGNFRINVEFVA